MSRASVGASVRSQPAPRYAIAGKIRIAAVLRGVSIGLLLEARRAMQPTGTALRSKARHVPVLAPRVGRRDRSTRADGAAFGKRVTGGAGERNSRSPSSGRKTVRSDERRSEEHTSELQSRENLVCRL